MALWFILVTIVLIYATTNLMLTGKNNFARSKKKTKSIRKLIWIDRGYSTEAFKNYEYKVIGKPDFLYAISRGVQLVEFKSRLGSIYKNDIIQAKCAALAARGAGHDVIEILIQTKSTQEKYLLPRNNFVLYSECQPYITYARQAKKGEPLRAFAIQNKCKSCSYNSSCENRYQKL